MFVQGSKNAALPILAAALLNDGVTTLENCPDILDVRHMIKIIESVGCLVERKGHQIIIHGGNVDVSSMRIDYVSKMRSSVILLGALLGRKGKVSDVYKRQDGNSLVLSLDYNIQMYAQQAAQKVMEAKDCLLYTSRCV